MEFIVSKIAKELSIKPWQVEKTIELLDDGNTVPFIARYRKEMTGALDDEVLRSFEERLGYLRNLVARKEEVIRIIDEQGKLTDDLRKEIEAAEVLQRVEDLYRPYKQKKSTRASKAKERGLEPLALWIMLSDQKESLAEKAAEFVNPELDVNTPEEAIQGAKDIIAEQVSDDPDYRKKIRMRFAKEGILESVASDAEAQTVYENYYEYQEPLRAIANHRVLAINRGEKEGHLKIKLLIDDQKIIDALKEWQIPPGDFVAREAYEEAIEDAYKRLIRPSIEREVRSALTERAEDDAILVFGKNTKPLLLQPPMKVIRVLGIDPSYRTGCKLTPIDETGKLLGYTTIYPNKPQMQVEKSRKVLKDFIAKYKPHVIAIGNGTASRETEQFVADTLSEVDQEVFYTIVSEAGASVYSASKLGAEEFPDLDVSVRGAVSIARRIQDPLAELVKIDPKSIGVGQYQHDVNQKKLSETLTHVVEDCVNNVGVDLNTASISLLQYISGISSTVAKNIIAYREEAGSFKKRKELLKVKRLGPKVFEQAAGFLRIPGGPELLDNTGVHPESYQATYDLLKALGYGDEEIKAGKFFDIELRAKGKLKDLSDSLSIGLPTLQDIVKELKKPGRDPREEMPKPIFKKDVLSIEDLKEGMEVTGTVRNVVNFGAFIDIGIKNDGLCHISELSDRYVSDPMDIVKVGDVVTVKIIGVDTKRNKISLSMKGL